MNVGYWGIKADGDFCLLDRGKEIEARAQALVDSVPYVAARVIVHLDMRVNELEGKLVELTTRVNLPF